jgi:hypothetical protein
MPGDNSPGCGTDHFLVVAEVRERLPVSKQTMQTFHMQKLNDAGGKEQYWVEVSNGFAASETLDDDVDINRTWESISENIKISAKEGLGYYKLKKHKPCFDKGSSKLSDQMKQSKRQWFQDPSEINGDNLNNIRCKATRHFRNKTREYLKDKINELATNSENKTTGDLYRGINQIEKNKISKA